MLWDSANLPPGYTIEELHLPRPTGVYAIEGYEKREYRVTLAGRQGHISLPKTWAGGRVAVVLVGEPADDESPQKR